MKPSGVEEASADEPVEVAGLMADGDDDDDAADDDTFVMVEAPEQTAPRRTPIERDDDTDAVHGSLMRTIQQKKGTATAAENESSVSEVAKLKQREVVSEEVRRPPFPRQISTHAPWPPVSLAGGLAHLGLVAPG
jgi:hypothetical protein